MLVTSGENNSLLERTTQTSPIKNNNLRLMSPLYLRYRNCVVLDFALFSKLVLSNYALYIVSVRRCKTLPSASFRLSYYSDNLNYPSKMIIRVMFKYDCQQTFLIKNTRIIIKSSLRLPFFHNFF